MDIIIIVAFSMQKHDLLLPFQFRKKYDLLMINTFITLSI